ncbi:MAG TPA: hypothetical protein VFG21_09195 [Xanthomonadaceae bacterium]|nr:hypothetical protein [Xanthomonadaceae bacterium]
MGRSILAVLAGVVAAGVTVFLLEAASHIVFQPPAGIDPGDPERLAEWMEQVPFGALVSVLIAWAVGTCLGGFVAARIARRAPVRHAVVVGVIELALGAMTVALIPHPLWFTIVGLACFVPMAALGGLLGRTSPAPG